jgi:hypothetical protein
MTLTFMARSLGIWRLIQERPAMASNNPRIECLRLRRNMIEVTNGHLIMRAPATGSDDWADVSIHPDSADLLLTLALAVDSPERMITVTPSTSGEILANLVDGDAVVTLKKATDQGWPDTDSPRLHPGKPVVQFAIDARYLRFLAKCAGKYGMVVFRPGEQAADHALGMAVYSSGEFLFGGPIMPMKVGEDIDDEDFGVVLKDSESRS